MNKYAHINTHTHTYPKPHTTAQRKKEWIDSLLPLTDYGVQIYSAKNSSLLEQVVPPPPPTQYLLSPSSLKKTL